MTQIPVRFELNFIEPPDNIHALMKEVFLYVRDFTFDGIDGVDITDPIIQENPYIILATITLTGNYTDAVIPHLQLFIESILRVEGLIGRIRFPQHEQFMIRPPVLPRLERRNRIHALYNALQKTLRGITRNRTRGHKKPRRTRR